MHLSFPCHGGGRTAETDCWGDGLLIQSQVENKEAWNAKFNSHHFHYASFSASTCIVTALTPDSTQCMLSLWPTFILWIQDSHPALFATAVCYSVIIVASLTKCPFSFFAWNLNYCYYLNVVMHFFLKKIRLVLHNFTHVNDACWLLWPSTSLQLLST